MSKFIFSALNGDPITIFGDGSQTRTFCYIDDNIEATTTAFYKQMFVNDVVNIGGSDEVPVLKLAETIIKLTNSKSAIQFLPALKEGDMTRRQPDTAKMKTLLNRPLLPLEEGLSRVIENHHRIH